MRLDILLMITQVENSRSQYPGLSDNSLKFYLKSGLLEHNGIHHGYILSFDQGPTLPYFCNYVWKTCTN